MAADLFISYSWTSPDHREWVRLLSANLKAIGYDVLVDADVNYGGSLSGFMGQATTCRHVLLIVDEQYVSKANKSPESGVGKENYWLRQAYPAKPESWLSVAFKNNPDWQLPDWLVEHLPRGLDFNAVSDLGETSGLGVFPGSEKIEEIWRWIEDLPANQDHATRVAALRKRCARLEKIDRERDPNTWVAPALEGEVEFEYERAPGSQYSLGFGELRFVLQASRHGMNQIYVLKDPIHSVGINRSRTEKLEELAEQLTPGRYVEPRVGEQVILQNSQGALCLIDLIEVRPERTTPRYVPTSIRFSYRILTDS